MNSLQEELYRKFRKIKRVAVVGAGTMGSQIAAYIANVGIPCDLLDIVPSDLASEACEDIMSRDSTVERNRIAESALDRMKNAKSHSPFYIRDAARLIRAGNLSDHADWLAEADWVVEAVTENLDVKKQVHGLIDRHRSHDTLVSSNTSGISIRAISEGRSDNYQECFVGTHFFNPPRYMHLLEIIPTDDTRTNLVEFISDFGERILGKGVVHCKDTPNFIANRIGTFSMMHTIHLMIDEGYTIDEVDAITGPLIGRPRSATFRLGDLIGIDILVDMAKNLHAAAPDDEPRAIFRMPDFILQMVERNWLGDKTGQGFYHRCPKEKGSEIWMLDYNTLEYVPRTSLQSHSLDAVKRISDVRARIKQLMDSNDREGRFMWKSLSNVMNYAATCIPEIADDLMSVDNAMKWGFNWELGIFEMWDAIGVPESVERMSSEGHSIPPLVARLLESGNTSFYSTGKAGGEHTKIAYFDLGSNGYQRTDTTPEVIILPDLKTNDKVVQSNSDASLIDIGDDVVCLEFHSKMNIINTPTIEMMLKALDEVERNHVGLVIGNHSDNFSVGLSLVLILEKARNKDWDAIDEIIRNFQMANMSLRYSPKPVVSAPSGMTFGGGCEIALNSDAVCAAAETYIGLVEVRVGLIPGAGGTKEMVLRSLENVPHDVTKEPFPYLKRAFDTIARSKVSESGLHATQLGYLRNTDRISINRRRHLFEAKQMVRSIAVSGYQQPQPREVLMSGRNGLARLKLEIHLMHCAKYISDYDAFVLNKLAYVICGGELSSPQHVSESYILDLEREAFLSLCGEEKTLKRIEFTLRTGKPLHN